MTSQSFLSVLDNYARNRLASDPLTPNLSRSAHEIRPPDRLTFVVRRHYFGHNPTPPGDPDFLPVFHPAQDFTQVVLNLTNRGGFHV
jgi:hypothetical protein